MIRAITFIPSSGGTGGLTYVERASRNRSLHVLMQDCRSAGAGPGPGSRGAFLRNAYREIISRYVSFGKIEHPLPLARALVAFLDNLSHRVDCRVDDFRGLGFYVLFQDGEVFYLLMGREGRARIRTRSGFETLATRELPGVTELPVESTRAQKELFSRDLRDFLALYRIEATELDHPAGHLELVLGGSGEEMDTLVEALEQPGVIENNVAEKTIPLNLLSHKMMVVTFDGIEKVRDLYPRPTARRTGARRAGVYTAAVVVFLLFAVSGVVWLGGRFGGTDVGERADVSAGVSHPAGGAGGVSVGDSAVAGTVDLAEVEIPGRTLGFSAGWSRRYSGGVTSSPLLQGGKVVFGARDGGLYALSADDGESVWSYRAGDGIGASPALSAGRVVSADYAGNVFAVAVDSGRELWRRKLPGKIVSSPCPGEGEVLIGCYDGAAYALSVETGRILWKVETAARIRASAAYADGVYYLPSYDGGLYAIAGGTGTVRWTYNIQKRISSSPAVAGGTVVVGGPEGGVYALETASGALRWKFDTERPVKSFVSIERGHVLCGDNDGRLYCIDLDTGSEVWRFESRGPVLGRPCVAENSVIFASYDENVYCVDFATGREIDRYDAGAPVFSSPAFGNSRVYFGTNEGAFHCLGLGEGETL